MAVSWKGVREGTPVGSKSLCETCIHAHIIRGQAISERLVLCMVSHNRPLQVPFAVVAECTSHREKDQPGLGYMQEIAYIMKTDDRGRPIGFVTNKQFRQEERVDKHDYIVRD